MRQSPPCAWPSPAKRYGDVARTKKLLEKQKAGKTKMRQFGKVDIAQEAFSIALKIDG